MKQHIFRSGENIEAIARQYGFRLPATIWDHPSNDELRELRRSPYALAVGDVLNIPDLQIKSEDASDERRHVFRLRGLVRPAFYSRLVPDPELQKARFGPVFAQPGAEGFDVSFAPHLHAALAHASRAHESARFQALFAGRGTLADAPLLQSVAYLLLGDRAAWIADALARHQEADLRTLLTWVANALGFPCDPGRPGTDLAQGIGHALRRLRAASNIQARALLHDADLEPRPAEDWATLFDAIEGRLRASLGLTKDEIAAARCKIQLLSPLWVDLTRSDGIEGTNPATSLDLVLLDDQVVKATPTPVHPLLAKAGSFVYASLETKHTPATFKPLRPDLLEFEDVHFGPGRSILLPTELTAAGPEDDWGITGADVLVAALRHAEEHPTRTIFVTGHTDSTSSKAANFDLSKRRAESVRMMLRGMDVADEWADLAAQHAVEDDAWEYLRWTSERLGYDCWPSPADSPNPARDAKALLAFRRRYNQDVADLAGIAPEDNPYYPAFTRPLNLRGALNREDWRAFFEMMQKYFVRALRTPMSQLLELQTKLNFGSEGLGCGESHPFDREERERRRLALYPDQNLGEQPRDRRVEIVFLDPDEAALLPTPMLCHPKPDAAACKPELCMLYDQKLFEFQRLSPVPQKGKIEIIERTVMRDNRLFTDEEQVLVEEASGDFTPILGEKVRILVRVTPPYTPFEGTLRLLIGRRTSSEAKPMSTVAQIDWKDPDTKNELVELDASRYFIVEWNGKGNKDVPREYSDRDVYDENRDEAVFIPMMEMNYAAKPKRVRHGAYFIERVQLLEKDEVPAVDYVPAEAEQNDLAMVVQVVVELVVTNSDEAWKPLAAIGFGDRAESQTVPFVRPYLEGIARQTSAYLCAANLRVVLTAGTSAQTAGLRVELYCPQHIVMTGDAAPEGDELGASRVQGYANLAFILDGDKFLGNHFLWYDAHDPRFREIGQNHDARVYNGTLLEATDSADSHATCVAVFSRTGYPSDRRMRWVTRPKGQWDTASHLVLEGGPNEPRVQHGDGTVIGQASWIDEQHVDVVIHRSTGHISVESTNPAYVPAQRAYDIERALNAVTSYSAALLAHELGHLLGATVSVGDGSMQFPMPDGDGPGPYMCQDHGGHDEPATLTGLMVAGDQWRFTQQLGVEGPPRSFRQQQSAYLRSVLPRAADFAESQGTTDQGLE